MGDQPQQVDGPIGPQQTAEQLPDEVPQFFLGPQRLLRHDLCQFFARRGNSPFQHGRVQLFLVLEVVIHGGRPLARRCITRHHYHHYRGFYATQQKLIAKEEPKRAKPVLYAYRVLMTGIHLLRTGEVEANLPRLNGHFGLTFLDELIALKVGGENISAGGLDWPFHEARLAELEAQLNRAFEESKLPEDRDRKPVNELLVQLRLGPAQPNAAGPGPSVGCVERTAGEMVGYARSQPLENVSASSGSVRVTHPREAASVLHLPYGEQLRLIHRHSGNTAQAQRLGPYTIESLIDLSEEGRATVYRVSIAPHQQTRISYHRVAEEYYFVMQGRGTALLDGREYLLEVGDFLRLPPGVTHGFIAADSPLEMLNIHTPGCRPDRDTYFADGEPPEGFAKDTSPV